MPSLIARTPCHGLLPVEIGQAALVELLPDAITSVARSRAARPEEFRAATGVAFPGPNRTTGRDGGRAVWSGPDQCFWIGPPLQRVKGHALTDQSDGWAVMRLKGASAEAVLARLTPIDLRIARFRRGHTARTIIGHMTVSLSRSAADAFDILCFRSMAGTAVKEFQDAMRAVHARGLIAG